MIAAIILYLLGAYLVYNDPGMDDEVRIAGTIGWPFFALYLVLAHLLEWNE